jgi:hypothetical protein
VELEGVIEMSHVDVSEVGPEVCAVLEHAAAPPGPVIAHVTVPVGGGVVATDTVATNVSVSVPELGSATLLPTTESVGVGLGGGR